MDSLKTIFMSTIEQLYKNIVTLMNQTFSTKKEVDDDITTHNTSSSAHSTEMAKKVNINQGNTNASKNVVTDSNGKITVEAKPTIPSKTSDLTNDSGFLTSHQDISGKANISDLATVATTGSYNDLSDKPSGFSVDSSLSSTSVNPVQNKVINTALNGKASTSHAHGNLTNDGKIGSSANYFVYTGTGGAVAAKQKIGNITTSGAIGTTSGLPLKTTTSGVITTGSFGTTSGTFCQGNDSRLHTHTFTYSNGSLTIN